MAVLQPVQAAMRIYGEVTVSSFLNTMSITLYDNGSDRVRNGVVTTAFDGWSSYIEGSDGYRIRAWWSSRNEITFDWSRPGFSDTLSCRAPCRRDCVGGGSRFDPKQCVSYCDYSCWYY
ncbi:hypothetical protein BGW38_003881 [Lunasporangiospora selenospora]|uniref:Uncharacterized protein n=1 Tax=Lunasporangiospora selenospora TaxID=979761 RepID=A0A9P6FQX3_9FUNG|nr:hypothetical protein BGW38_003881 [Lunasporangiospora selenospora]